MTELPVVDINPLMQGHSDGKNATIASIEHACHHIGFMAIAGHEIAPAQIQRVRSAVANFFALPLVEKNKFRISRNNYRGYIPLGFFSPNDASGQPDRYEGYKLHLEVETDDPIREQCDLYGPNKWPRTLPNLKTEVLGYWSQCDRIAAVLLEAFAAILEVDAELFSKAFEQPLTNMTLLHYPSCEPAKNAFGIHPHKDTDAFTILAPDPVGGLMVKTRRGKRWIEAQREPELLIVNIGDLLELWSGGYFVSTPHKVVNQTGQARISFPYFAVPRYDTFVSPLVKPRTSFDRSGLDVGEVSREVWRTNWPDTAPVNDALDLGTLPDY